MKKLAVFVFLFSLSAMAKDVTLTIDDAPLPDGHVYSGLKRTERLIAALKKERVQTVFFCNPSRLDEANGRERLQMYADAGYFIANHTYSHPSLNKISPDIFNSEIDQADKELRQFSTFKKWFRFPFLKEGLSVEARDRVREHLRKLGYINGYVTVDAYDYVIDGFVQRGLAEKRPVDLERACRMLSDLTLDGLEDQRKAAQGNFGKDVVQVLLLHENDVEAYCLGRTIQALKNHGWKFVSPDVAFSQPALAQEPKTTWLDQGRINAFIAERSGRNLKLKWDDMSALNRELNRRGIVNGLQAE